MAVSLMEDRSRTSNLVLPYALSAAILAIALGFSPKLGSGRANASRTANDISVGTSIRLPNRDVFGAPIDPLEKTLIVFGGSCTGCSLNSVDPNQLAKLGFPQIVLIYAASETQIQTQVSKLNKDIRVLADPSADLVHKLGAVSAPRFYLLDDSRVVNVCKDIQPWPQQWLQGAAR